MKTIYVTDSVSQTIERRYDTYDLWVVDQATHGSRCMCKGNANNPNSLFIKMKESDNCTFGNHHCPCSYLTYFVYKAFYIMLDCTSRQEEKYCLIDTQYVHVSIRYYYMISL